LFSGRWIAGLKTAMDPAMAPKRMLENKPTCSTAYQMIFSEDALQQQHRSCALQCSGNAHLSLGRKIEYIDGASQDPQTNAGQQNNMLHCKSVDKMQVCFFRRAIAL
jgi:hypothetical protein